MIPLKSKYVECHIFMTLIGGCRE